MINKKLKFTVLHIPKTGGNSLHFLLKEKGLYDDIMGEMPNQNGKEDINPVKGYKKHDSLKERIRHLKKIGENPDEYDFLFTIRNPWDHMVSWFFWYNKAYDPQSFNNFIRKTKRSVDGGFFDKYEGFEKVSSYFIRTESQLEDLNDYFKKHDIQFDKIKPRNVSRKRKNEHYSKFYKDDKLIDLIAEGHKWMIDKFGYEFESDKVC